MKIVRTTGLAAIVALALMAWLGAGSALAVETTLCKTATNSPLCEPEDRYPAGTVIGAKAIGNVVIENSTADIKCGESQLEAKTNAVSSGPFSQSLPLTVSAWTLGKCGTNATQNNCTVIAQEAGKEGSLLWTAEDDGTLSASATWRLECKIFGFTKIDCTFGLNVGATLKGGNPAQLAIPKTTLSKSTPGTMCPTTASLQAVNYDVTSPKPAHVARELATQLCKAEESPCSASNSYQKGTLIEANSANFTIETQQGAYTCGSASMTAETQSALGNPLPTQMLSFNLGTCKLQGLGSCSVKTTFQPPTFGAGGVEWAGGFDGELGFLATSWEFTCGSPSKSWEFESPKIALIEGGNPATFSFNTAITCKPVKTACLTAPVLKANFTVAPKPLYVVQG